MSRQRVLRSEFHNHGSPEPTSHIQLLLLVDERVEQQDSVLPAHLLIAGAEADLSLLNAVGILTVAHLEDQLLAGVVEEDLVADCATRYVARRVIQR